jgi:hypothetical protein
MSEQAEVEHAEVEEKQVEQSDIDQTSEDAPQAEQQNEPAGLVITLGDDEPQQEEEQARAPEWVRELRKANREKDKRIRELEQEKASREAANAPGAIKVGEKPTLEDCEYDPERFETELTAWHERKRQADEQAAAQRKEQESAQAAWQQRVTAYNAAKAALPVDDYDDSEGAVTGALDQVKQAILLKAAKKPEKLIYALGKSPAKLKELAAITDLIEFAGEVARLETTMKETQRKAPPPAEKVIQGSGGTRVSTDSTLDKLREEALRTGDLSKVMAYKASKRAA